MYDFNRNQLKAEMFCAIHKTPLRLSSNLSQMGGSDGNSVGVQIFVHPCADCTDEYKNLKYAVQSVLRHSKQDVLDEVDNLVKDDANAKDHS